MYNKVISHQPSVMREDMLGIVAALVFSLFTLGPVFAEAPALDLTTVGSGARALGLGLAQNAASRDISALFFNPAGLGNLKQATLSGMTGTLLQEVSYVSVLSAAPTPLGVFGLGYIGGLLRGIPVTSRTGSGGTTVVTPEDTSSYSAQQIVLSYGTALSRFFETEWAGKLRLGADIRLFLEQIPDRLNRQTLDVSYGLQHILSRYLSWSIVTRSGLLSGGIRIYLPWREEELEVFSDVVSVLGLPPLIRGGLEWRAVPDFALRLGLIQRWKAGSVQTGFTGGVGLLISGLSLDYAYHPLGEFQDNTAHFFSLGLLFERTLARQDFVKTVVPARLVPKPALMTFGDVDPQLWAEAPIRYLSTLGIMKGYPDGTFRPKETVSVKELQEYLGGALEAPIDVNVPVRESTSLTRREAVWMIVQASGLSPERNAPSPFSDLSENDLAMGYIATARTEGLLEYMSDEPFESNRLITRAEVAEILSKLAPVKARIKEFLTNPPAPDRI